MKSFFVYATMILTVFGLYAALMGSISASSPFPRGASGPCGPGQYYVNLKLQGSTNEQWTMKGRNVHDITISGCIQPPQ